MTNREGASCSFEWNLENDAFALKLATEIVIGVTYVQDITVWRLLTNDSCGPIAFIATVNYNNL